MQLKPKFEVSISKKKYFDQQRIYQKVWKILLSNQNNLLGLRKDRNQLEKEQFPVVKSDLDSFFNFHNCTNPYIHAQNVLIDQLATAKQLYLESQTICMMNQSSHQISQECSKFSKKISKGSKFEISPLLSQSNIKCPVKKMKKISSFAFLFCSILFIIFISEKNYSAEAFQCQTILPTLESVVEEVTGAFSVNAIQYSLLT